MAPCNNPRRVAASPSAKRSAGGVVAKSANMAPSETAQAGTAMWTGQAGGGRDERIPPGLLCGRELFLNLNAMNGEMISTPR